MADSSMMYAGFDPTQFSNIYSNYTNGPLPGTSYSGVPVNAGTGLPVSTYTPPPPPPAPVPPPAATPGTTLNGGGSINYAGMGPAGPAIQELMGNYQTAQGNLTPQQQFIQAQNNAIRQQQLQEQDMLTASANAGGGRGQSPGGAFNPGSSYSPIMGAGGGFAPSGIMSSANPYGSASAQAYLQALARPDKVVTPGIPGIDATYQPDSAGIMNIINQMASLQGSGQNQPLTDPNATGRGTSAITGYAGNSGFLNALAALRGAPGAAPAAKG